MPAAKGATHVLRLIRELLAFDPAQHEYRRGAGLRRADFAPAQRRVSDQRFQDAGYERTLRIMTAARLIAVSVSDPREHELPDAGLIELEDAETGALIAVDTGSKSVRRAYAASALARAAALREILRSMDMDLIEVVRPTITCWT